VFSAFPYGAGIAGEFEAAVSKVFNLITLPELVGDFICQPDLQLSFTGIVKKPGMWLSHIISVCDAILQLYEALAPPS
jgi:hypothetical protein